MGATGRGVGVRPRVPEEETASQQAARRPSRRGRATEVALRPAATGPRPDRVFDRDDPALSHIHMLLTRARSSQRREARRRAARWGGRRRPPHPAFSTSARGCVWRPRPVPNVASSFPVGGRGVGGGGGGGGGIFRCPGRRHFQDLPGQFGQKGVFSKSDRTLDSPIPEPEKHIQLAISTKQ